jgi:hypothetical protein
VVSGDGPPDSHNPYPAVKHIDTGTISASGDRENGLTTFIASGANLRCSKQKQFKAVPAITGCITDVSGGKRSQFQRYSENINSSTVATLKGTEYRDVEANLNFNYKIDNGLSSGNPDDW